MVAGEHLLGFFFLLFVGFDGKKFKGSIIMSEDNDKNLLHRPLYALQVESVSLVVKMLKTLTTFRCADL